MSNTENSTDFIIYQSRDEEVLKKFRDFASAFAKCITVGEWHGAYNFLASWLQAQISPDDLRLAVEERLLEMNGYWGIEELILPVNFNVDFNPLSLAELKEPMSYREPYNFSDELTYENFRKWMMIQFMPDENDPRTEMDAWFDFWFVVAEVHGEYKIGFFEFEYPD